MDAITPFLTMPATQAAAIARNAGSAGCNCPRGCGTWERLLDAERQLERATNGYVTARRAWAEHLDAIAAAA